MKEIIPIDFVGGTHGHFLEYVLNGFFGFTPINKLPFTDIGTSHKKSKEYLDSRIFIAKHWHEPQYVEHLTKYKKCINIVFREEDLLTVGSISLLRSSDSNIHNNLLENNTVSKLKNSQYEFLLNEIFSAYPFLDQKNDNIPRYVLREFYKFSFRYPEKNGLWKKLNDQLLACPKKDCFNIQVTDLYNINKFVKTIHNLEEWLNLSFRFDEEFYKIHDLFINKVQFLNDKRICDLIINDVIEARDCIIPSLNLFQESYINAQLEILFKKEMPFYQLDYFKNTQDLLNYIKHQAPNLPNDN